ncbi:MAG: tail fiber domain-containing protein, partial [bacterium]
SYSFIGGGRYNYIDGKYSAIVGGFADTIAAGADYSYLFGIDSKLTEDSTFMVDMPHIRFGNETSGYEFPVTDGSADQILVTDGSGLLSWNDVPPDTDWIIFGTDMYSGVSGNVGIGTTSPLEKLHIAGDDTLGRLLISSVATTVDHDAELILAENVNNSYNMSLKYDGGTNELYVYGRAGATVYGPHLTIERDGEVGINKINPSYALDVDGTVAMTGFRLTTGASNGYVLTSNASGTGTWQPVGSDNDWVRGTPDSVLYTANHLGIARGGASNMLYGNVHRHVNLGSYACTTGLSGASFGDITILSGYSCVADSPYATVVNGIDNEAIGQYSYIGNGNANMAYGQQSFIGNGNANHAYGYRSFIGSGYSNDGGNGMSDTGAVVVGGWDNASTARYTFVGGGQTNSATGNHCVVVGGLDNTASVLRTFVGGGENNSASADRASICGGLDNNADGWFAFIGGGYADTVMAYWGSIGGGYSNLAGNATADTAATVVGGWDNSSTARYTFVGGGQTNSATGNHCVVVGGLDNTASVLRTFVGGGENNSASADRASICGGLDNNADGWFAFIGGGHADTVMAYWGSIGGGYSNLAGNATTDTATTVAGGWENSATNKYASISGGKSNTAISEYGYVGGGYLNSASGTYCTTVGGGYSNEVTANYASILGGYNNTAQNTYSVVCGGIGGTASGIYGFIGNGNSNYASGTYSFVGNGTADTVYAYAGAIISGFNNRVGFVTSGNGDTASVIVGGSNNYAYDDYSFIGGGLNNAATRYSVVVGGSDNAMIIGADYVTICGGTNNYSGSDFTFVGGGNADTARGDYSVVVGGRVNETHDVYSAVVGGRNNDAHGNYSFIGGGYSNYTNGTYATIPGGYNNTADGYCSFAFGYNADVNGYDSVAVFDWGTGLGTVFIGRDGAASAYRLYVSGSAYCTGSWATSDQEFKTNVQSILDPLELVKQMNPVHFQWKHGYEDYGIKGGRDDYGFIAQEIQNVLPEVVGEGATEKHLAVNYDHITAVNTAAIQQLAQLVEKLQGENTELKKRLEILENKTSF